jgi:guanosine-3',5'-bis(diphosphate) 3'-pyrophosphohydrolase
VLLVKLGDRLHNMRTLDYMSPQKRRRIAEETMDIYAPLAGRMGMQDMRSELENLAFRTLQPDHYQAITDRLAELQSEFKETIDSIKREVTTKLKEQGIDARVSSRVKSAWSIATKIERKQIALEQLSDMIGFRIIVPTIADCYRALGIVHTNWKVVPGRFKDYISVPKHNDYRSIHTTIVGLGRQRIELQIRTEDMHRVAEYGIAAHAAYKEGATGDMVKLSNESQAFAWLRQTIEHITTGSTQEDFLEYTKLELFQDQVFCFTPRGRLIALPRGATPIDFAYALHTDIGDTTVGAKINGAIMPLVTHLQSGDEVEILRDQNHLPPANWETIAATGKARSAIRRAVRASQQQRAYALGERMLHSLLDREGLSLDEDEAEQLARALGHSSKRDLLVAVGEGKLETDTLNTELAAVKGIKRRRKKVLELPTPDKAEGWFALRDTDLFRFRVPGGQSSGPNAKLALAQLNFATRVQISPEGVVPGDRLVGIMRPDMPIMIYPVHSDDLAALHDSDVAWMDVRWDIAGREDRNHKVVISMLVSNKPGSLAQISSAIAAAEANIHNLVMRIVSPDFHKNIFELEVRDLGQLTDVLSALKLTHGLSQVRRATVAEAESVAIAEWNGAEADEKGNT